MEIIEQIKTLSSELRTAIEKTSYSSPPMDRFPKGCCGEASIFLSEYLMEHGYETTYYCGLHPRGEKQNPQSHAWVELGDGLIVDITGDQFYDDEEHLNYNKAVYVGKVDRFHRLFSIQQTKHIGGIDYYDERNRIVLRAQYNRIKENL